MSEMMRKMPARRAHRLSLAGYAICIALTFMSKDMYVAVAWDSAGVTTGPVTVPLVLALGIGVRAD